MIKGIFLLEKLTKEKIKQIIKLKADSVFIGHQNLELKLVERLKNTGIKVYTEIGIFVGEEWWERYPDSCPVDKNGKLMDKIHWYAGVCPNNPEVRKEKFQLIKSLIKTQNVDGIWLDFIRYPCHWEELRNANITEYCFCPNCLMGFSKAVKTPRMVCKALLRGGGKIEDVWIRWKCKQITDFVAEVRTLINQSGKNIKLGMFSVPWRKEDFRGAITRIVGQDFLSLAKYIDVFSPMVYQKMCGKDTKWIHRIVSYMSKATNKTILPIVQTEDKPNKLTTKEFSREINQALKPSSAGAIVFFLEDLLKNSKKFQIVKEVFR